MQQSADMAEAFLLAVGEDLNRTPQQMKRIIDTVVYDNWFEDVLSGTSTREDSEIWAWQAIELLESGSLEFTPATDEQRIWRRLTYLHGIDLLSAPGTYLHTSEDIRTAYEALRNGQMD